MSIFLMGGGQVTAVKEHRGGVAIKATCYRGLYNDAEHPDMPPRTKYAEAEDDMQAYCKARRDAEGGMVSYALAMRPPKATLPGTDEPFPEGTPSCPEAIFKPGDVVKIRPLKSLQHFPSEAIVAVAVPPGFPGEYALADLLNEPRPAGDITKPRKVISYILVREGDRVPYHANEGHLMPSGKPPVELGTFAREHA